MVLALVALGVGKRFKSKMPLAGSCSAAISAQCHLSIDDDREEIALGCVTWGETVSPPVWAVVNNVQHPAHCGFTSKAVIRPSRNKVYA